MSRKIDLKGQRFGRLIVLGESNQRTSDGRIMWDCLCSCGNHKTVSGKNLRKKLTQSCGCINKERMKEESSKRIEYAEDLTGKTFGRLIVIRKISLEQHGSNNMYLCQCQCGNTKQIKGASLLKGLTRSCGCLLSEKSSKRAVKTFGHIDGTTISRIKKKNPYKNSTTGIRGVYYRKDLDKYVAIIGFKKRLYHLGTFSSIEMAAKARAAAENEIYGNFLDWYKSNIKDNNYPTD